MKIDPMYSNIEAKKTFYKLGKIRLARVTTILNELNKPALIVWSRRQALKRVNDLLCCYNENGRYSLSEQDKEYMLAQAEKEPDKQKDDAADKGTQIHNAIERWLVKGDVVDSDKDVIVCLEAFKSWWLKSGYELVQAEMRVASIKHKYAGTLDLLAKKEGKYVLFDFKTSKGVYDSHGMQCSAYTEAIKEMTGLCVEDAKILHIPSKKPGKLDVYNVDLKKAWICFMSCLILKANKKGVLI